MWPRRKDVDTVRPFEISRSMVLISGHILSHSRPEKKVRPNVPRSTTNFLCVCRISRILFEQNLLHINHAALWASHLDAFMITNVQICEKIKLNLRYWPPGCPPVEKMWSNTIQGALPADNISNDEWLSPLNCSSPSWACPIVRTHLKTAQD